MKHSHKKLSHLILTTPCKMGIIILILTLGDTKGCRFPLQGRDSALCYSFRTAQRWTQQRDSRKGQLNKWDLKSLKRKNWGQKLSKKPRKNSNPILIPNSQPLLKIAQSSLTLCNPMDCRPPGSSVHRILQARILEWVAISFSRGIFPTQGLKPGLCLWRQMLYHLSHQGSPNLY